jgi:hypothetical protein
MQKQLIPLYDPRALALDLSINIGTYEKAFTLYLSVINDTLIFVRRHAIHHLVGIVLGMTVGNHDRFRWV